MSSIDVVIPCYRYGRYLRQCVESVLAQEVADLRVLVIDDRSPDETPEVAAALVRADARVTYRRHEQNRGHIGTFNEGIDWTAADYMLLLSADDYLLPGALKRAMAVMDAHADAGLCFGEALELQDGTGMQPLTVDVGTDGGPPIVMSGADFVRLCIRGGSINPVPSPTAVVRTSLLKRLGGYRHELYHTSDLEMWLRLAAHGSVGIVKTRQAVYRRHSANMSLDFAHDHGFPDLQQRKSAFDIFLQTCTGSLPETEALYHDLLKPLATEAVARASSAYNRGYLDLSHRLSEFAANADPGVRHSFAWQRLACKRLLGLRLASALLLAVAHIKAGMAKIRG